MYNLEHLPWRFATVERRSVGVPQSHLYFMLQEAFEYLAPTRTMVLWLLFAVFTTPLQYVRSTMMSAIQFTPLTGRRLHHDHLALKLWRESKLDFTGLVLVCDAAGCNGNCCSRRTRGGVIDLHPGNMFLHFLLRRFNVPEGIESKILRNIQGTSDVAARVTFKLPKTHVGAINVNREVTGCRIRIENVKTVLSTIFHHNYIFTLHILVAFGTDNSQTVTTKTYGPVFCL